jgi:hypothetical protein
MIFYIGDDCPLQALVQFESRLFLDKGWKHKSGAWYKGYSTECVLSERVDDILEGYQPAGKWCVIKNEQLYYPVLRGFPVFEKNGDLTNLKIEDFDFVAYHIQAAPNVETTLSIEEVSSQICDILTENTENFYKYNNVDEITLIYSGGLDTLTCWAVHEQVNPKFNLSVHLPTETDTTSLLFAGTRRDYQTDVMDLLSATNWGYEHHCFHKQSNWGISGYYAEAYTYRDIAAITGLAKYFGKEIDELASEDDYYYHFFKRPNLVETFNKIRSEIVIDTENSLRKYLWESFWHDHQFWHLDTNLVFCPFADIRIPEISFNLSFEDMMKISVNGDIQRNIVRNLRPEYLSLLSDYKNSGRIFGNFRTNFNESMLHPDTKLIYR